MVTLANEPYSYSSSDSDWDELLVFHHFIERREMDLSLNWKVTGGNGRHLIPSHGLDKVQLTFTHLDPPI